VLVIMKRHFIPTCACAALLLAAPGLAQTTGNSTPASEPAATAIDEGGSTAAKKDAEEEAQEKLVQALKEGRPVTIQHLRAPDKRGLNTFESPKIAGPEYTGFRLDFGANFASQVQNLRHSNRAEPVMANGVNTNQLADIGFGFNNSTANLTLHAQLAKGIRVQLTSYLSSRHHNETWVKDGFILMDESPIDIKPLNTLMKYVTLKVGHMEINYGDAHFRRSDNGNAIYNPFIGNYIMDAFTTEIGGEVYLRHKGLIAMGAIMGGEIRGTVLTPEKRGQSYIGKLGFDRQMNEDLRVRLTGSMYRTRKALSNTLYGGDRAGSRYYFVMENTAATESAQFTSGLVNPGFRNEVTAFQVNPFVKFRGLELFGVAERAEGKASTETSRRQIKQFAADAVYRLGPGEPLYVAARFNRVQGQLAGIANDITVDRVAIGGGWFITPGLLGKLEYVNQEYRGFPPTNIRSGGKFHGLMLEGVVAF
jgi:hypothetical protein